MLLNATGSASPPPQKMGSLLPAVTAGRRDPVSIGPLPEHPCLCADISSLRFPGDEAVAVETALLFFPSLPPPPHRAFLLLIVTWGPALPPPSSGGAPAVAAVAFWGTSLYGWLPPAGVQPAVRAHLYTPVARTSSHAAVVRPGRAVRSRHTRGVLHA